MPRVLMELVSCLKRWFARIAPVAAVTVMLPGLAKAGVPSEATSVPPSLVTVTDAGTDCFAVVVRDLASNPVVGASVVVDVSTCGIVLCPTQPAGHVLVAPGQVRVFSDSSGTARFTLCGSVTGGGCQAVIRADGVMLGTRSVVDPDVGYVETAFPTPYTGPADSLQFGAFLANSPHPAIVSLSAATKAALLQNLVFRLGIPRGMRASTPEIAQLYATPGQLQAVMSAIHGTAVTVRSGAATRTSLLANNGGVPPSYCENCDIPRSAGETCCTVPGDGCCDYVTFGPDGTAYRVLVPAPFAFAGADRTIGPGQSTSIGQAPAPGYAYRWEPQAGLSSAVVANPVASPAATTTYRLLVYSRPEIADTSEVTITVATLASVPGAGPIALGVGALVLIVLAVGVRSRVATASRPI